MTLKTASRTELASTLGELLDWVRPTGKLKTVECRQFLESLQQQDILQLPDKRHQTKQRKTQIVLTNAIEDCELIQGSLKDYPVFLELVESQEDRRLWKELIERYHSLGYRIPFGAHLRYLIRTEKKTPIGCLQFSSPAWRMAARDKWIGWSEALRKNNLQRIINNSRFLILPHVKIKNLASHVLSVATRHVVEDWQAGYHIKPLLIETLVDKKKFKGGCYRAANWLEVGVSNVQEINYSFESLAKVLQ